MKIALVSHVFAPQIGGIETVSQILADEFTAAGHEVIVVTQSPSTLPGQKGMAKEKRAAPRRFRVVRRPRAAEMLRLALWSDVFFQNNISLQTAWPMLFARRPFVIAYHTWLQHGGASSAPPVRLKRAVTRFATSIAVSEAIAGELPPQRRAVTLIGNPYDDTLFRELPGVSRDLELAFLGRLVKDKGVDLLLNALAHLRSRGIRPRLTLIGDGDERGALAEMTERLSLGDQVTFAGAQSGEALVRLLNRHRILVAPSRWKEPFGVVALEGIACGCVAVGTNGGGLGDAIGPCGVTVPNNDAVSLANTLAGLLESPEKCASYRSHAAEHLAKHTGRAVAARYLDVFDEARAFAVR